MYLNTPSYITQKPSEEITEEYIKRELKTILSNQIGEALTPKRKNEIKQQIGQLLNQAKAAQITEQIPDVFVYQYEDCFCRECHRQIYWDIPNDSTNLTLEIGHPKREEYCPHCLEFLQRLEEINSEDEED